MLAYVGAISPLVACADRGFTQHSCHAQATLPSPAVHWRSGCLYPRTNCLPSVSMAGSRPWHFVAIRLGALLSWLQQSRRHTRELSVRCPTEEVLEGGHQVTSKTVSLQSSCVPKSSLAATSTLNDWLNQAPSHMCTIQVCMPKYMHAPGITIHPRHTCSRTPPHTPTNHITQPTHAHPLIDCFETPS